MEMTYDGLHKRNQLIKRDRNINMVLGLFMGFGLLILPFVLAFLLKMIIGD